MKLPESIRVAHVDVEILATDQRWTSIEDMWGSFSPGEMLIRVNVEQRQFYDILATLMHEITHVIYWAYHLEDADKQEHICSVLGTAWSQIYRDNPHLAEFVVLGGNPRETMDEYATRRRAECPNA